MEITILNQNTDLKYFKIWSELYGEMTKNYNDHSKGLRKDLEKIDEDCIKHELTTPDLYFLAIDGEQASGYGMIQLKTTSQSIPDECYAHIYVSEKYRRKGIGSAILGKMLESMNTSFIKMIFLFAEDEISVNFLKGHKGITVESGKTYVYDLKNEPTSVEPKIDISVVIEDDPSSIVYEKIIEVYNQAKADEPKGYSERSHTDHTAHDLEELLTRYAKKTVICYAIHQFKVIGVSELMFSHNYDDRVFQRFTGSHPEFRRMGVGKKVKSELIKYIRTNHPEIKFIETSTNDDNIAINSVNTSLGFEEQGVEVTYEFYSE
ncbi:MAG: GNAT family N-acetyltransferase [Candidatus Heimdallarchaeota archaeon]|nr:GNAT family N-acetyltransferase [Candidatus Heimdallarchaeota archaeon]